MNIGVFYQSGYKLVACYKALQQLRKFYPDIPVALFEDGSDILKPVADKFNCDYKKTTVLGSNAALSGRPVKDINSNIAWLGRIHEACTTTLKNVEWVIVYEDDVWCTRKIKVPPRFDLSGANGPVYFEPLRQYMFNRFKTNANERGHWSPKGTLESYQACGGTIFNREKFIQAYNRINEIDWNEIIKMDDRPCEWSDASLSFVMQHAGFTCGRWDDWNNYNSYNLGSPHDKTGWAVHMNMQTDHAFLHMYKHFYNYRPDELSIAENKFETRGYFLIGLGCRYIDECFNLGLTIRKQKDNREIALLVNEEDVEYAKSKGMFDKIILFKPDTNSDLWKICNNSFEKYCLYPRLHLDLYTPFDYTIIVDSDELCQYSTEGLWKRFVSEDFPIQMCGRIKDDNWHWGTVREVGAAFGKQVNHVHGGFIFMNVNSPLTKQFFDTMRKIVFSYDNLKCKRWYQGGMTDEILFAITHAEMGKNPIPFDEFPVIAFNYGTDINPPSTLQTEGNQNVNLSSPIPFVHMFDKIDGERYCALFKKILMM